MDKDRANEKESREQAPQTPETPADNTADPSTEASNKAYETALLEVEDLRQKLIRWQADFQNLQRRSARELLEARERAEADFVKSLLTVLDHFDLALNVDPAKVDAVSLFNGLKITYDELKKVLANRGIVSFDPTGQPFDPHQHEAIMQEASDKVPPMTVLQTFQAGYKSGDWILRPAKVKVSK